MNRPYVFLDIDGVLNVLRKPDDDHRFEKVWITLEDRYEGPYPIHIRETVLMWIRQAASAYDLHWVTTWQDHANSALAPAFDLPSLPVAARTDEEFGVAASDGDWKLAGVLNTLAQDPRPFVWIDDEAIPRTPERHFRHLGVPWLCIKPSPSRGLSDAQLTEIDTFLATTTSEHGHD